MNEERVALSEARRLIYVAKRALILAKAGL